MTPEPPKYHLLYVEDSPGDREFMTVAFQAANPRATISTVANGVEGLRYIRKEGPYANVQRPDIVLLDLKLPGKDGHEVLAEIKADRRFRKIPVILLTSSKLAEDVSRAYDLGANCYLPKPPDARGYNGVVHALNEFWFTLALLPEGER